MLEERGNVPVTGVVPYMELSLEDEDSLSERFLEKEVGLIDIAVIHYPRISNFTDFHVFEQIPGVSVRYVTSVRELQHPDLIFLPGSKKYNGRFKMDAAKRFRGSNQTTVRGSSGLWDLWRLSDVRV